MYQLDADQIQFLEHLREMLRLRRDSLQELCQTERSDIEYGFDLGKAYSHLRDLHVDLMDLISDVKKKHREGEGLGANNT